MHEIDRRYTMRFRNVGGFRDNDPIPMDIAGGQEVGVWDTIDRRFVKRDPVTNEWVTE